MKRSLLLWSVVIVLSGLHSVSANEVNKTAPDCAFTSLDGTHRNRLQDFKGKVLYVDFWASWCGPCVKSFPYFNQLQQKYAEQGVQVLAINLDEELSEAQAFLQKIPPSFTVLADPEQQCAKAFSLKGMPSSYLIDRQGVVRHINLGFHGDEAKAIELKLEQLLAEKQ